MPPIVREMGKMGYDAVVLGNHEFVSNDKASLDEMVLDFTDYSIPVLSANLYKNKTNPYINGYYENYVNSYIIKKIETEQGILKVGILGLTIKEVGESRLGQQELKDMPGYGGSLVLTDLIPEAVKLASLMKANGADVIIAVVHSGEEPRKPRHPGNKIKELVQNVGGVDAIVAAHTHVNIPEHKLRNKAGETVIVTQPGKWGEHCSRINFVLIKENGKWKVKDKSSLTQKM
jgi:2',3'-cyclic-nucleotide 2'-phosphodiesterase (5'-nucleotidase family)